MSTYHPTQIANARAIVDVGRSMGITDRGITIGLAVALVEGNCWNYANAKVPGSLALPHDRVGSDGLSVGVMQQQVRTGADGRWWWGPVAVCQSVDGAARLFFGALKAASYDTATSDRAAGIIAQSIQRSAYPDRYGERMTEARALLAQLTTTTTTGAHDRGYCGNVFRL